MADVKNELADPKQTVVSKEEFDKVVAERDRLARAVERLIDAMSRRYAQDIYREAMSDETK